MADGIALALGAEGEWLQGQLRGGLARTFTRQGARGPYTSSATASGGLSRSLRYFVRPQSYGQALTVYGTGYWPFADAGRGPGKRPPISALLAWIAAKGLSEGPKEDLGFAFALARTIARRGTAKPPSEFVTALLPDFRRRVTGAVAEAVRNGIITSFSVGSRAD